MRRRQEKKRGKEKVAKKWGEEMEEGESKRKVEKETGKGRKEGGGGEDQMKGEVERRIKTDYQFRE